MRAHTTTLFLIIFACLVWLTLLGGRQFLESRGEDEHHPHLRRGGFGPRPRRGLTWPTAILFVLMIGATLALLVVVTGHYASWWDMR